jgi:hypothetical protein
VPAWQALLDPEVIDQISPDEPRRGYLIGVEVCAQKHVLAVKVFPQTPYMLVHGENNTLYHPSAVVTKSQGHVRQSPVRTAIIVGPAPVAGGRIEMNGVEPTSCRRCLFDRALDLMLLHGDDPVYAGGEVRVRVLMVLQVAPVDL